MFDLPSTDSNHVPVGCHEEFGRVSYARRAFSRRGSADSNPRVFDFIRYEGEDKRLARSKISLSTAVAIFRIPFCPPTWAIGSEYLITRRIEKCFNWIKYKVFNHRFFFFYFFSGSFDDEDNGFVLFYSVEERRHAAAVLLGCVQQLWLIHGDPHRKPRPHRQQLRGVGRE